MWNLLIEGDRNLFLLINNGLANGVNDLFLGGMTLVGYIHVLLPLSAVYLFVIDKKMFRRNMIILIVAIAVGAIFLHITKEIVSRARPLKDMGELIAAGKIHIHNLFYPLKENSFPSGHTQGAFSTAAILSCIKRKHTFYFILAASLIGLSRIYVGVHFPLDVICGAALGSITSIIVYRQFSKREFLLTRP